MVSPGTRSVARRFLRAAVPLAAHPAAVRAIDGASSRAELADALQHPEAAQHAALQALGRCVLQPVSSVPAARKLMVS